MAAFVAVCLRQNMLGNKSSIRKYAELMRGNEWNGMSLRSVSLICIVQSIYASHVDDIGQK